MVIGIPPIAPGKLRWWHWLGPVGRDRKTLQLVSDKLSHHFWTSYRAKALATTCSVLPLVGTVPLTRTTSLLQAFRLCLARWRVKKNHTRRLITMKGEALEAAMERYEKIVSLKSLRVSSPRRLSGEAWKGRRACNYVSGIWIPLLRLSCQISASQLEAETSANVNKHYWKTRAKGNNVITNYNVIFVNQHFASTFSMQVFKFQIRSCNLSFSRPDARAPRTTYSQARTLTAFGYVTKKISSLTPEHELPVGKIIRQISCDETAHVWVKKSQETRRGMN